MSVDESPTPEPFTPFQCWVQSGEPLEIVIPVRGQTHFTRSLIDNLKAVTHVPYRVTIVENPSDDPLPESPDYMIIRQETKCVAESWNIGIQATTGPFIAVLNNDLVIGPKTLDHLVDAIFRFDLWCVSPRNTRCDMPEGWYAEAQRLSEQPPEIVNEGMVGCCFLLTRKAYETIGPFDENYLHWFEENDYENRLGQALHPPKRIVHAQIHHWEGRTTSVYLTDVNARIDHSLKHYKSKWG